MANRAASVADRLRAFGGGRPLDVCIFARGSLAVVERVAAEGHRTVVVGDRFRPLFAAHNRLEGMGSAAFLAIEATFDDLPLAHRALDALILPGGMPAGHQVADALTRLRATLRRGGLLIWLHPSTDGLRGRFGQLFTPLLPRTARAMSRPELCAAVMAAAYGEIRQEQTSGRLLSWSITSGIAGGRPWEPRKS